MIPRTLPSGTPHHRLTTRTLFVTAPGGVVISVAPEHTEAIAERFARLIPTHAIGHVAAGDYWLVTERYAETARRIMLITSGEMLRLWAPSYPAALERLARWGRGETARRQGGQAA